MPLPTSLRVVIRAASQFGENGDSQMGAALAYYALFATAPLLILAVMVASLFYPEEVAREQVREHLHRYVGPDSAREISALMEKAGRPAGGTLAAVLNIALLLLGTLGLFLHLRRCLCIIWRLDPPGGGGILWTLLNYLLSLLAVFVVGLLLLLSLVASTALGILIKYQEQLLGGALPGGGALWHWLGVGVSLVLLTLFFAVLYWVLSARRISWGYILYGSVISALLLTVGKTAIALYLAYTSTATVYGAAGSLVAFLIWVYYTSQITFFGAELIQARRTLGEWTASSPPPSVNAGES